MQYTIHPVKNGIVIVILLLEDILHQLRLVVYPIIYSFFYIPGSCLGFLNHQRYVVTRSTDDPRIFSIKHRPFWLDCVFIFCRSVAGHTWSLKRLNHQIMCVFLGVTF